MAGMTATDGRRARGDLSRSTVLAVAADLASVDGLDGLTLGGLAATTSLSKAGIAGLFGSKQDLQLAVVASAAETFRDHVVAPALSAPPGLPRLSALVDGFLRYSETRVFTGGCFFAAVTAEYRAKPGPVRDAIAAHLRTWAEFVAGAVTRAVEAGDLAEATDAAQVAYELTALLDAANNASLLHGSVEPYVRTRRAIAELLAARAPVSDDA